MAKETERPEWLKREMSDYRSSEIIQPCMHCKNLISVGNQFDAAGWTCPAFPEEIPYNTVLGSNPHTTPFASQVGTDVYDPKIYKEEDTGREWHYSADGTWRYVKDSL